jgi:hypothetical protein
MERTMPQKKPPDLTGLDDTLDAVDGLAEELGRASELPVVNEDGSSECPFAEELYARKEEVQERAQAMFKKLHEYKKGAQQLLREFERDRIVIKGDQDRIHGDSAREHYSEAEAIVAGKISHYTRQLKRIEHAIKVLDKALQVAVTKRFPGKIPEKLPFDSSPPVSDDDPLPDDEPWRLNRESDEQEDPD